MVLLVIPFLIHCLSQQDDTVDGRNPAPRKKPRKNDAPVTTNKHECPTIARWCEMDFVHSIWKLRCLRLRTKLQAAAPSLPPGDFAQPQPGGALRAPAPARFQQLGWGQTRRGTRWVEVSWRLPFFELALVGPRAL